MLARQRSPLLFTAPSANANASAGAGTASSAFWKASSKTPKASSKTPKASSKTRKASSKTPKCIFQESEGIFQGREGIYQGSEGLYGITEGIFGVLGGIYQDPEERAAGRGDVFRIPVGLDRSCGGFAGTFGEPAGTSSGRSFTEKRPAFTGNCRPLTGADPDFCEVDRDAGAGCVPLTHDTTPDCNDTAPFPSPAAKWKYRAIFRVRDARVGR